MIKHICPHCDKKLNVKDHLAGQAVTCPNCKKKSRVEDVLHGNTELETPINNEMKILVNRIAALEKRNRQLMTSIGVVAFLIVAIGTMSYRTASSFSNYKDKNLEIAAQSILASAEIAAKTKSADSHFTKDKNGNLIYAGPIWAQSFILMDNNYTKVGALDFGTSDKPDTIGLGLRVYDREGNLRASLFNELLLQRTRFHMYDVEGGSIVSAMANGRPGLGFMVLEGLRVNTPPVIGRD